MKNSNIDTLKELGNEYFKDSFFNKPIKPVIRYGRNDLQIGKTFDGRVFTIDIHEAMRVLFMGLTGAGKTWFFRTIGDRLLKIDQTVAYLTDIKNEFYSSKFPVQAKFQHMLLPGEEAVGAKIVVLRPTFFRSLSTTLPEHNVWYSIDMKELSRADFMTLLNSQDLQPNQRTTLELIYQSMKKKLEEEGIEELTYNDIIKIVDEMEDIDNRQRNTIKFKLKPLEYSHFFDAEHSKNVATAMKNGYVPAVNFENFDSFGKGDLQYPEVTLNIVLREIIHARRAKKIKRVWLFIDEATRFVGNDKHNCFKDSILESIDVDRRFGVSYCLGKDTLIKTQMGDKKISELDEDDDYVMSYDFKNSSYEWAKFRKFNTGKKSVKKITFAHGDYILASEDHKFFVKDDDGRIVERHVKDLNEKDAIVSTGPVDVFNGMKNVSHTKESKQKMKISCSKRKILKEELEV